MKKQTGFWLAAASILALLPAAPALAGSFSVLSADDFSASLNAPHAESLINITLPDWINLLPSRPRSSSSSSSSKSVSSSSSSKSSSSSSQHSSSSAANGTLASIRQRIIELVNNERSKNGLPALREESHLTTAAQDHAEDMKKRNYNEHDTPEGKTPTDQIRDAGYPLNGSWYTGQNIAWGQTTPEEVMNDWMNSSGHRANILSKNFQDIGVGFYQNDWVQDFGSHSR